MTKFEIEENLDKIVSMLKKSYVDLELDYYYNDKLGTYELIFFGEKYEYDDVFWNEVDALVFQNFTCNDTYMPYYYTDSFYEKIRDNKNMIIENQNFTITFPDYDPAYNVLKAYVEGSVSVNILEKNIVGIQKENSRYSVNYINQESNKLLEDKSDYILEGGEDGSENSRYRN